MVNSIIEEIKKGLTGDPKTDMIYLQEQGVKYQHHPQGLEILKVLSDMSFDLLPEESKKEFKVAMFIGEKRLDQVYNDAANALRQRDFDTAADLLSKIEEKADKYFTMDNGFSFRNRLDEYLYIQLHKPEKNSVRTPFDFCKYFSAFGYLLIEQRKPEEAVAKLEKAIRYNPVNIEPRFELAEAYKLLGQPEKLLECTKDMLNICLTPQHLARCYTNFGYYCIDIKDYDSAIAFYYDSLIYAPNPNVQGELQHIGALTMKTIEQPTREDILAAFDKYGAKEGPDHDTVNLIYSLGCYCMEHNAPAQESLFYMQLVYDMTRDEKVQDTIDMLKAQIAVHNAGMR